MTKKIISALAFLSTVGMLLSVSACNTVEGAGKDVARAGNAIHDKAAEEKNERN